MNEKAFYELAREHFAKVLAPVGFTCADSAYATFYRRAGADIYHFVAPDLATRGAWYDIKVFASSPEIEPQFEAKFPDDLGIPSNSLCYLHPRSGVGPNQKMYACKTDSGFRTGFENNATGALRDHAQPYLDRIDSLETLLPTIRSDFYRGVALWKTGRRAEGKQFLMREIERLSPVRDPTGQVEAAVGFMRQLLAA